MNNVLKRIAIYTLLFCGLILSSNVTVRAQKLIDEFDYDNTENGIIRLDNFFIELHNAPAFRGYIIVYGPKNPKRGEIEAHIGQIPTYINFRKFDRGRIAILKGGYRDSAVVKIALWMAAPGDKTPRPSGTIALKKVKFRKGAFDQKSIYWCC